MIEFTPAKLGHFKYLKVPSAQSDEFKAFSVPGYLEGLLGSGLAFTAWSSGVCLGAAGIIKLAGWPQRGECWTLIGDEARYHMLAIIKFVRMVVETAPEKRLDMLVRAGNAKGEKLAKLAGFEYEATLECYHPLGDDVHMYKRIKR